MVCCLFFNGIPNGDYHWIFHDKKATTFEEDVNIVLQYHRTSKKDHIKLEFAKTPNVKFIGKCKKSSDTLDRDPKKPNLFYAYCKKQGHTNDTCRRHERKSTNTPPQEKSTNHTTNATPHKRIKFVDQVCMVRIRIGATILDPSVPNNNSI